jgi:uncharacterized membrane protein
MIRFQLHQELLSISPSHSIVVIVTAVVTIIVTAVVTIIVTAVVTIIVTAVVTRGVMLTTHPYLVPRS